MADANVHVGLCVGGFVFLCLWCSGAWRLLVTKNGTMRALGYVECSLVLCTYQQRERVAACSGEHGSEPSKCLSS